MNRVQLSILAFVIAAPLLAYPVLFPPAMPGTQLVAQVDPVDSADHEPPDHSISTENFTADERSYLETLLDEHRLERPVDDAPGWFRTLSEDGDGGGTVLLEHEGDHYRVWAYTTTPAPPLSAVAPRLLSFVLATIIGAGAGYAYVTADG